MNITNVLRPTPLANPTCDPMALQGLYKILTILDWLDRKRKHQPKCGQRRTPITVGDRSCGPPTHETKSYIELGWSGQYTQHPCNLNHGSEHGLLRAQSNHEI